MMQPQYNETREQDLAFEKLESAVRLHAMEMQLEARREHASPRVIDFPRPTNEGEKGGAA